jgi:hypothetical protein
VARDKHEKRQASAKIPGPFTWLLNGTMDSPAWRALSHGAQMLYIALKRRYNVKDHNNGRIFLSTRMAAEELNSNLHQIGRWFRELQYYGFIVQLSEGTYFGPGRRGKAPYWRLTEVGYMHEPATEDFKRWNGQPFRDKKGPRKSKIVVPEGDGIVQFPRPKNGKRF